MDYDSSDSDNFRCLANALGGIFHQSSSYALPLPSAINGKSPKQYAWNWVWLIASKLAGNESGTDLGRRKTVVAHDSELIERNIGPAGTA